MSVQTLEIHSIRNIHVLHDDHGHTIYAVQNVMQFKSVITTSRIYSTRLYLFHMNVQRKTLLIWK